MLLSLRFPCVTCAFWSRWSAYKITFLRRTSPIRRSRWSSSRTSLLGYRGSRGAFLLPRCFFGCENMELLVRASNDLGGVDAYTALGTDMSHLRKSRIHNPITIRMCYSILPLLFTNCTTGMHRWKWHCLAPSSVTGTASTHTQFKPM